MLLSAAPTIFARSPAGTPIVTSTVPATDALQNRDPLASRSELEPDGSRVATGLPGVDRRLVWVLAMIPFLVLVVLHWSFGPLPISGDQAQYMMHARALVEGGSYSETGYIFTRYSPYVGPTVYPPGFPLTLAPVLLLLGPNEAAMKLVVALSVAAAALAAGLYFARRNDPWLGVGVALLTALVFEATHIINSPAADAGFCALVWLTVLVVDRPGRWSAGRILAVTALGLIAVAYRLAGVALGPALVLYGLLRFRDHGVRPLLPAAIWAGLALIGAAIMSFDLVVGGVFLLDPRIIHRHLQTFFLLYRLAILESHLYPFPWSAANDAYHLLSLPLALLGLAVWLRSSWRSFAASFGLAYFVMLLLVPVKTGRYLLPLVPLLLFGLLNGIRIVVGLAARRWPRVRVSQFAAATAAVIGLLTVLTHAPAPRPASLTENAEARELFAHLESLHEREPLRVAFANPRLLTWETRIPAMSTFEASPDAARAELRVKRISHLIVDDLGLQPGADSAMRALIAARPADFALEFGNATFQVYRVLPSRESAAGL